jgi:hypothetical protein
MSTENLGIVVAGVVLSLGLLGYFARKIEIIVTKQGKNYSAVIRLK